MRTKAPLLSRPGDPAHWASLLTIEPTDFDMLHLTHPGCGEFETLQDWFFYFFKYLNEIDRMTIFIQQFDASPRRYIQHHAAIARGEVTE